MRTNEVATMLGGIGLGAALMYVLDPDRGRRRRALVRDKLVSATHKTADAVGATARDVRNRANALNPRRLFETEGTSHEQDDTQRRNSRFELMQENWSPTARLLAGATGGTLAVYGFSRRDPLSILVGSVGAGLLLRGVTNMEIKRLTGIGAGRRAIELQKDINIAAPVDQVYWFWSEVSNFPLFMSHVREVRETGEGLSHWRVEGPAGMPVEWDAIVTKDIPNRLIAWKTVEGSTVAHAGVVRFDQNEDGTTRVGLRLSYNPPAGAVGHALAMLLGADPKRQMDDDLMRMKTMIETGELPRDAGGENY